jgi:hypothetical protein
MSPTRRPGVGCHWRWGTEANGAFICRLSSDPFPVKQITVLGRMFRAESHIVVNMTFSVRQT